LRRPRRRTSFDGTRSGRVVAPASSCRYACSRGCSADCSCGNWRTAFGAGRLRFFGKLGNLAKPQAFARRLGDLRRLNWVVYAKPPFGGPEQVLAYLGRYTHRVAIANSRLLSLADGKVRFTGKTTGRAARPR
jgi:Putative transposase.